MLRVGLSGGIGSGKSTVAGRLREHGAVVIDADVIAREVVEPGTPGLAELVERFGADILADDGSLNRKALAAKAFADDAARRALNSIVHPKVATRTEQLVAEVGRAAEDAIVVHDVPLLVENQLASRYHLVLMVDAPVKTRLARLIQRGMSETDAQARIAAQASDEARRAAADVWLDNSAAIDTVLSTVDALWADRLVPFEANIRLRRPRPARAVELSPYNPDWPAQAARAIARIRAAAGKHAVRIDHIGSTAIAGLAAKDVLDLQLTISTMDDADAIVDRLSDAGFVRGEGDWWDAVPQEPAKTWPKRFHFGADPGRPINLHVRSEQTPAWRLALLFVAYLREHPAEQSAYLAEKQHLAKKFADDATSDRYTSAKQTWVNAAFERAENWATTIDWSPTN